MKRLIVNVLAMSLAMTLWAPRIATAQVGYNWTDISGQLTERANRPVWAVAYANGSWFYTDGQDLWNGGQAYRYDGTTQVNITTDVRNAGLTRVDDIVSDGTSVLFLKNVVRRDNSFEILKWSGSSYSGLGSYVRNAFASDEGISSISGRNGTWMIVTTKGRAFTWNGDRMNAAQIALPANLQTNVSNIIRDDVANGITNSFAYASGNFRVVPISGSNWLFVLSKEHYQRPMPYPFVTQIYRYNGGSFSDISSQFGTYNDFTVESNGEDALLVDRCASCRRVYGHDVARNYKFVNGTGIRSYSSDVDLFGNMLWMGSSWMLFGGENKHIIRIAESAVTDLGASRDYLVDGAANYSGTVLIGGAASDFNNSQPTLPLTAKLLWVTEGEVSTNTAGGSFGGDRTYTSVNGPKIIAQGNPSDFRVGNGKEFAYRVTATDADGVDRTDLYINDARIKTCYDSVCEFRTTYWTSGVTTKAVKFWVRSTDKRGYSTDTSASPDYLTVDANSTATAGGTVTTTPAAGTTTNTTSGTAVTDKGTGIASWQWFDPNKTSLNANESVIYNVGANDSDGIKKIEIYVNGSVKKTVDLGGAKGNQTGSLTIYANDYPENTGIYVNAKITDGADKFTWTAGTTIWRNANNGSASVSANSDVSAWNWFDPAGELKRGNAATFRAGAWAKDGLSSMELYVNGSLKKTCGFSRAYGNQDCYVTLYGSDYAAGTQIAANTKAIDANGKAAWSELKYVNVIEANATSGSSYGGTNNPPVVWDWIEIGKDFITVDDKAKYVTGAWDENGIASVAFYVNGSLKQTIWLGTAYGNQQHPYEIMGLNYPVGSSVFVNAKVTDATGKETWTAGKTFKVMGTGATTSADYANNGAVSSWTNKAAYSPTDYVYVTGNGSDPDGVSRAEIYVNGERVKTCTYDNQKSVSCETTVGPFPNLTSAAYAVTLFDRYGYETTTGYKQVAIVK